MNKPHHIADADPAARRADLFARRIAARLNAGADALPHDITERLRVARQQALARRRQPQAVAHRQPAAQVLASGAAAVMGGGSERMDFWGRLASIALVLVLMAGLIVIPLMESEDRAAAVAEVDAALLTDDLPPEAYADPGFAEFLQTGARPASAASPAPAK